MRAFLKPDGACVKFYRDIDEKELSINFEGSKGMFQPTCRTEVCVFTNEKNSFPEQTHYPANDKELSDIIHSFMNEKL